MDVLKPLSQIYAWCLFVHIRHVFELRQSAARCFGLVQLKHNFFSLNNFLPSEVVFTVWQHADLWSDFLQYKHSVWCWFACHTLLGFLWGLVLLSSDKGLWFKGLGFIQVQFSRASTNCGNSRPANHHQSLPDLP